MYHKVGNFKDNKLHYFVDFIATLKLVPQNLIVVYNYPVRACAKGVKQSFCMSFCWHENHHFGKSRHLSDSYAWGMCSTEL